MKRTGPGGKRGEYAPWFSQKKEEVSAPAMREKKKGQKLFTLRRRERGFVLNQGKRKKCLPKRGSSIIFTRGKKKRSTCRCRKKRNAVRLTEGREHSNCRQTIEEEDEYRGGVLSAGEKNIGHGKEGDIKDGEKSALCEYVMEGEVGGKRPAGRAHPRKKKGGGR